jgi:hypothetical protein
MKPDEAGAATGAPARRGTGPGRVQSSAATAAAATNHNGDLIEDMAATIHTSIRSMEQRWFYTRESAVP